MSGKLTPKQKAFAEYYIQTGNAAEAARRAGYSKKTAETIGRENLRKLTISQYIAERVRPTEEKRIADSDEIMLFFSEAMRGHIKDQFGLDASLADRMTAANSLHKIIDAGKMRNTEEFDQSILEALDASEEGAADGDVPI